MAAHDAIATTRAKVSCVQPCAAAVVSEVARALDAAAAAESGPDLLGGARARPSATTAARA
jgi:hypothetical protein